MEFFSNFSALLPNLPLSRILANPHVNATFRYVLGKIYVVIETHWTAPTPTHPPPFVHDPTAAPSGPRPFISLPLDRPHYLAAHSITSTSSPFMFTPIFISGCIIFFFYIAQTIYCQSNRLAELRIIAQGNFDILEKNFKIAERARHKEAGMMQYKFGVVASFVEEADRRAEDTEEKLETLLQRIDELEKQKVRDEEMRVANDKKIQQQLNDAETRIEENKNEVLKKLKESDMARSKGHEGYVASLKAAASVGEAREHKLRAEIEEREKRNLRWATEMMEKNETRYREDMDKLRVDHRMDLDQMKSENVKREALHTQELNELHTRDTERYDVLLLSIEEAIMRDVQLRTEEKEKEDEARLAEKEEERAVLSKMRSDISRSVNWILELKTKSVVRSMEQLKGKTEVQGQLRTLFKDVGECQRGLELVRKQRRERVDIDGRGHEHGIAVIQKPAALHRPPSPDLPLQGLPTPAASQSPPPHEFPPEQVATVIGRQSFDAHVGSPPRAKVKQEVMSFDLHHAAVYEYLETEAKVAIETPNDIVSSHSNFAIGTNGIDVENVLPLDQSISLSKISGADDLLSVAPPCWSDTSLFESLSLDYAFYRGRTLPNDSLILSRAALPNSDDLKEVSPPQWPQSESPDSVCNVRRPTNDSFVLSDAALFSGDDLKEISPPPWLQRSVCETDSGKAPFADGSLLLSTNKAGIKIKCHSPTPSPSRFAMSALSDFDCFTFFRPQCTSSPSGPQTLKITTGFDDSSFVHAHKAFLPTSSSWLGCHPVALQLNGTSDLNPVKQESKSDDCIPISQVVLETSLPAPQSPSYPSMSAYLPALASTRAVFPTVRSTSPSPTKVIVTNNPVLPVMQKLKEKRRKSYDDKPRASAAGAQDHHHRSLPVIVPDLFNPF